MGNKIFLQSCPQFGIPTPTPEYKFHQTRKWRIDYYFETPQKRVGLEVEGGIHTGGRHVRGNGFEADIEKYNAMSEAGIFLLRVAPKDLTKTATFEMIKRCLYGQQNQGL